VLKLSAEIGSKTKASLDTRQREALLREQMAAIQRELGDEGSNKQELADLEKAIAEAKMPPEVEAVARKELRRLQRTPEAAGEYSMIRTYLDMLIELPWAPPQPKDIDIAEARRVPRCRPLRPRQDQAADRRVPRRAQACARGKAPILCFVGPPGVGKTSLGQSIAKAMGRKFARISLGGVHDEAEIRGHRRTYIGAAAGQHHPGDPQGRRARLRLDAGRDRQDGRRHPRRSVGGTARGARSGAELDVPRQLPRRARSTSVAWCSSPPPNMLDTIPGPLRDRMEIIQLSSYTAGEKMEIAKRYLVRRQLEANGLKAEQVEIEDAALRRIIDGYTREAGVRSLEREIGRVLRHVAVEFAEGRSEKKRIGRRRDRKDPGTGALRERGGDAARACRAWRRARLDAGWRRHPVHRGDPHIRAADACSSPASSARS
jgi:ATP-dependent Lon protease